MSSEAGRTSADTRKVCGLVMPIASMGDEYPEEHWRRVRKILERAIERAGLRSQLVWENPEVDIIQSAILQNIYENDVVICDVSGLNSNVMLEAGLRLSTKRPTIIVTDKIIKPPFDISNIGYIDYQKDLEYNAIEDFIGRLQKKISDVVRAADEGNYKSFVETFRFETVTPTKVSLTTNEFLLEKFSELSSAINRLERSQQRAAATTVTATTPRLRSGISGPPLTTVVGTFEVQMSQEQADELETNLDEMYPEVFSLVYPESDNKFEVIIKKHTSCKISDRNIMNKATETIAEYGGSWHLR